ncbi:MAG: HAMP domain-containing sensor histidine kinase [Myxococcota bacterium]
MNPPFLRRLLIGAAAVCAMVGLLFIVTLNTVRPAIHSASVKHQLGSIDHTTCNADPESWGWASGDLSFFAYDRDGRSLNPAAPPIEPHLLSQALATDGVGMETSPDRISFVMRRASEGPCAVLRATSRNLDATISSRIRGALAIAIVVAMSAAVLGTYLLVVRPLRSRIEEVATAARSVGSDSFEPRPRATDALGHIADVLARSHERLTDARGALEARNQALEQHLAGVAHDLRTPLASMHLALEALATESRGAVRDDARRALADAVFLSSMVENLHQAARLRHEVDVTSGRVELSDLVRRVEKRFAIVGRHAGVEVAANTPEREVWVACTPALAERAVANLVQNAVEHNDETGHVAVALSLEDSGRRFRLVVTDDGPGMPQEAMADLHTESFLLDEARPRGPGMGTLITKEVARRAGWSVRYAPVDPTGLEVQLEGPVLDGE